MATQPYPKLILQSIRRAESQVDDIEDDTRVDAFSADVQWASQPVFGRAFTQVAAPISAYGFYGFAESPLVTEIAGLKEQVEKLAAAVDRLTQRLDASEPEHEIREVSYADAKAEISKYLEAHSKDALYPSDVADALHLDVELVMTALDELKSEGVVRQVPPTEVAPRRG